MRSRDIANSAVMAIWLASERYAGVSTNGSRVASQKTSSNQRQRICSSKCRLTLAKEACGAPHEQGHHHEVDQECPEPGEIVLARHVAHAEDQRCGERAA